MFCGVCRSYKYDVLKTYTFFLYCSHIYIVSEDQVSDSCSKMRQAYVL